jgi:hypothetical protein
MAGAHKDNTATFEELTYSEQASSINSEMIHLEDAIKANIRRSIAEGRDTPINKRIQNLKDMIRRLEEI